MNHQSWIAVLLVLAFVCSPLSCGQASAEYPEKRLDSDVTERGGIPGGPFREITQEQKRIAEYITAAGAGDIETVRRFLAEGMAVDAANNSGTTALMEAAAQGRIEMLKLLMDKGAKRGNKNKAGQTATDYACATKQVAVLKLFFEIKSMNEDDYFLWAAEFGATDIVKSLLAQGKYQGQPDVMRHALENACISGRPDTLKLLLEHTDPSKIKNFCRLIFWAQRHQPVQGVRLLLDNGADVNCRNDEGWAPLHLACHTKQKDVMELLFQRNADVNAQDQEGRTPLIVAVHIGDVSIEIVRMLVKKGADLNIKDKKGNTTLKHAMNNPHAADAVKVLKRAGAR